MHPKLTPSLVLVSQSFPIAMGKRAQQTTPATSKARKSSKLKSKIAGKRISTIGVLMWAENEETTWFLTQKVLKEDVLPALGAEYVELGSEPDLILMGSLKRDPSWKGSKRQESFDNRSDKTEVSKWTAWLKSDKGIKLTVREHLSTLHWGEQGDDGWEPAGPAGRPDKLLREKLRANR